MVRNNLKLPRWLLLSLLSMLFVVLDCTGNFKTHAFTQFRNHHSITERKNKRYLSHGLSTTSNDFFPSHQNLSTESGWQVFIDQSQASLDRGGAATLDAFIGLAPNDIIEVIPANFPKSKYKGPLIRCVPASPTRASLEISNVDSVDKVYRVLTKHLGVKTVNETACECLKWKYKGSSQLDSGKVMLAIDSYNKALATGFTEQEPVILLLRSTAYLRRAEAHKVELISTIQELLREVVMNTDSSLLQGNDNNYNFMLDGGLESVTMPNSALSRVIQGGKRLKSDLFKKAQYRHGLYQFALLYAAQDSLRATHLLPNYPTSWVKAGEILSKLWKLKESGQYYDRAMELDKSLNLKPIMAQLQKRQKILQRARTVGWAEDSLRLALDVMG